MKGTSDSLFNNKLGSGGGEGWGKGWCPYSLMYSNNKGGGGSSFVNESGWEVIHYLITKRKSLLNSKRV